MPDLFFSKSVEVGNFPFKIQELLSTSPGTNYRVTMIRKGVLLLLFTIHLTSVKFLLIRLGNKHQINNFNGK